MTLKTHRIQERVETLKLMAQLPEQTLIGPDEVAALFGVSVETIRRARHRNPNLVPSPLSNSSLLRWRLGDVLASIENQPTK